GYAQGFDQWNVVPETDEKTKYAPARAMFAEMDRMLNARDSAKPLFLYVHLMDIHSPYNAADSFRDPFVDEVRRAPASRRIENSKSKAGRIFGPAKSTRDIDKQLWLRPEYWSALYDAGIKELDANLIRFRSTLKRHELGDNSILIVTADHGEALYEQGGWSHGMSPYDHQYHVPLLFHAPKRWPTPRRIETTVSLVGLKSTVLDVVGLKSEALNQGPSFAPMLDGGPPPDEPFAFCEGVKGYGNQKAIYRGPYKIVHDTDSADAACFDLREDPLELQRNPIPENDPEFMKLRRRLDEILAESSRLQSHFKPSRKPLPRDQIDRLKKLGYLNEDEIETEWAQQLRHVDPADRYYGGFSFKRPYRPPDRP
ncbi:MAG: sulfatase-like hydrolase/transferase, partial [Phycisphaerae bacterium]